MPFSKPQLLSFDCYGTLIDWESGIFSVLRPLLARHGKQLTDAALLELYGELEAQAELPPYRSYREVLQSVVRGFGQRCGFTPSPAECQALPESLGRWQPFPDTVAALQKLKSRYQLAILSNIDDDLFALTAPQLRVPFDFVITAQQAQAYKPSLKLFELAEQRLGVKRESWLHVAQSVFHDVVPAQQLGLSTVWINRPSPRAGVGAVKAAFARADFEFSSLGALAAAFFGD